MNTLEWIEAILAIVSGILVCVPLAHKVVVLTKKNTQEKNWTALMKMVMGYMEKAEELFDDGASKKAYVIGMIEQSASMVNYEIDMDVVSAMIDQICATSKVVNAPVA